ncbi:hypothetical protein [Mesobacillus jeotgali]|uniref:Uncharacterized protein n=1 Tax=Mesobacillus jeotgali TaxID=129985 RepID=A0ABY9VBQ8_9BACI|nr:hypothetical protein [Mesobacillus jeotgali]WNF21326.1 hypothetical protein RH061_14090 [Mesobacillus jeotgali]
MYFLRDNDIKVGTLSYPDFCIKVNQFSGDLFQEFCYRFFHLTNTVITATKSVGVNGDKRTDGMLGTGAYLACFGPEKYSNYDDIDVKIKTKMKEDFNNLFLEHEDLTRMVFITKTDRGMGPKTIEMKKELESERYQKQLYREKNWIHEREIVKIRYMDKINMFYYLLRFVKEEKDLEYLFDNRISFEKAPVKLTHLLDDPAFIRECLYETSRRFNKKNIHHGIIQREIFEIEQLIQTKIDRDKRKYNVNNAEDIPYEEWGIVQAEGMEDFDVDFDIPPGYQYLSNKYYLTPLVLLELLKRIRIQLITSKAQIPPFSEVFSNTYFEYLYRLVVSETESYIQFETLMTKVRPKTNFFKERLKELE